MASESLSLAPVFLGEVAEGFAPLASPAVLLGSGLLVPNKLLPLVVSGPSEGKMSWERSRDCKYTDGIVIDLNHGAILLSSFTSFPVFDTEFPSSFSFHIEILTYQTNHVEIKMTNQPIKIRESNRPSVSQSASQ